MAQSLRPYLEYQADRVEAVLVAHRAPARITGGTVGPRLIRFFLNPAPQVRLSAIRALADDLALALRVPNLRVAAGPEGLVLEFPHPEPRPVTLLELLPEVAPLPVSACVLGLTEEGSPLLARLASPEVAHILIAGTTGSGKSALLRTIAASLILSHRPAVLRLLCIDPKGRTFAPLSGLGAVAEGEGPLLRPPVTEVAEAVEALQSLVRVMEARDRRGENAPRLVVMIDELADLILQEATVGRAVETALTRLVQRGREAGIHVIAATQRPSAAVLSGVVRANFPLRLVGKVVSAEDARVAAGQAGTGAHLLAGRGDFLAVGGSAQPIRFQVAFIGEDELRQQVRGLRRGQPALQGPAPLRVLEAMPAGR